MNEREVLAIAILKEEKHDNGNYAYISAYQLAVLMYKQDSNIFSDLKAEHLGGKDTGDYYSWAQYLARHLKNDNIEQGFFSRKGLIEFSFEDENGDEQKASDKVFSVFKYI